MIGGKGVTVFFHQRTQMVIGDAVGRHGSPVGLALIIEAFGRDASGRGRGKQVQNKTRVFRIGTPADPHCMDPTINSPPPPQ
jgi:hypothetical protein